MPDDAPDAATRTPVNAGDAVGALLCLASGTAAAYVDGVRVRSWSDPPALLSAEAVLEAAAFGVDRRAPTSVVLGPGAVAFVWNLRDLRRAARRDAKVADALRRCHEAALLELAAGA